MIKHWTGFRRRRKRCKTLPERIIVCGKMYVFISRKNYVTMLWPNAQVHIKMLLW